MPPSSILLLRLLFLCAFFEIPNGFNFQTLKINRATFQLRANKGDGYQFGDITRSVVGKFQKDVNSVTGKEKYQFGDFSRWLDKQGRGKASQLVESFTNKSNYEFGDISREVIRRLQSGQYSSDDVWLFLKIVAMVGVNLQPIASVLPVKVVIELLEASVAQQMGEKVVSTLTTEVNQRMKEFVTGDKDYKLGDLTKKAVTGSKDYQFGDLTKRAAASFTKKETYQFGDISRALLAKRQGDETSSTSPAESTKLMDSLDIDTKQALEAWDKKYLANKEDESKLQKLELDVWDEKLLSVGKEEKGKSE